MNLQTTNPIKTMLSTEIAELTSKRHDHVMRDIRIIIENLKAHTINSNIRQNRV